MTRAGTRARAIKDLRRALEALERASLNAALDTDAFARLHSLAERLREEIARLA